MCCGACLLWCLLESCGGFGLRLFLLFRLFNVCLAERLWLIMCKFYYFGVCLRFGWLCNALLLGVVLTCLPVLVI